jgi:hypothetical protein
VRKDEFMAFAARSMIPHLVKGGILPLNSLRPKKEQSVGEKIRAVAISCGDAL